MGVDILITYNCLQRALATNSSMYERAYWRSARSCGLHIEMLEAGAMLYTAQPDAFAPYIDRGLSA